MERAATDSIRTKITGTRVTELPVYPELSAHAPLQTITVRIPLIHNPNQMRIRLPIWIGKIRQTIREMQTHFSGMSISFALGWCREDGLWDPHLCVDTDAELTSETRAFLASWSDILRSRFKQRSIYMRESGIVKWI